MGLHPRRWNVSGSEVCPFPVQCPNACQTWFSKLSSLPAGRSRGSVECGLEDPSVQMAAPSMGSGSLWDLLEGDLPTGQEHRFGNWVRSRFLKHPSHSTFSTVTHAAYDKCWITLNQRWISSHYGSVKQTRKWRLQHSLPCISSQHNLHVL